MLGYTLREPFETYKSLKFSSGVEGDKFFKQVIKNWYSGFIQLSQNQGTLDLPFINSLQSMDMPSNKELSIIF